MEQNKIYHNDWMNNTLEDAFFIYNRDYQLLGGSGTLEGVAIMLGVELAKVKAALDRRAFVGNFQLMVKTSKITLRFVSPKEYESLNQIWLKNNIMDISQLKEIFMEGMASFAETFDTSKEFKNPYDCITQPSQHAAWKNGWTASYELMQLSLNEKY